jgi:hypothetical protein
LAQQSLYGYCQHPAFSNALQNGTGKDLLRKMLGLWIRRGQGWGAYQGMILAAHYGLKDGLVAAQNVLRDGASPTVVRQIAIFAVAKLGDEGHLPLLERLLQDETVCAARRVDDVEFVTQIRDVALAALIHLTKLDPQDFGLVRTKLQGTFLVDAENVGFADEDKREQALQRWRQYRAQQKQRAVQR